MKLKYFILGALIFVVLTFFIMGGIKNHQKIDNKFDNGQINNTNLPNFPRDKQQSKQINISNLPKFVHYNFIELDKIAQISKFRSGVGHDFSRGTNETRSCRSMKNYFEPIGINETFRLRERNGEISKSDWPTVKYFSPVSGIIIDMRPSKNIFGEEENQFVIQSKEYPNIWFSFFHVITKPELYVGSEVIGGEFLGTISAGNSGEIAVSINPNQDEQLVSFFKLVDNTVFSEYKLRGVNSREDFIITKEERDKKPLQCAKEMPNRFIGNWFTSNKREYDNWSMSSDNWVFLQNIQK